MPCLRHDVRGFKKTGRLGCDRCYGAFEKGLMALIETVHKSRKHVGKVPSRARGSVDRLRLVGELEKKLKEAVESEEFEKAARLRDRIQELRGGDARPQGGGRTPEEAAAD